MLFVKLFGVKKGYLSGFMFGVNINKGWLKWVKIRGYVKKMLKILGTKNIITTRNPRSVAVLRKRSVVLTSFSISLLNAALDPADCTIIASNFIF